MSKNPSLVTLFIIIGLCVFAALCDSLVYRLSRWSDSTTSLETRAKYMSGAKVLAALAEYLFMSAFAMPLIYVVWVLFFVP